ncbi:MAG: metallophosphoesterase [Candidatus Heimdallarchaeota archaeon]
MAREVIYVVGDLHIGDPKSQWRLALAYLQTVRKPQPQLVIFNGDTFECRYAANHLVEALEEFQEFCETLDSMGLLTRAVFVRGNHDSAVEEVFERGDVVVEPYVLVWCGDCDVLVIHGDGVGLEVAVNKYDGANTSALLEVKEGLKEKGHPRLPTISEKDWLVTSHFDSGVCNATYQVCGLGSWRGEAIWADGKKGLCAYIDPYATIPERTVWLRKVI